MTSFIMAPIICLKWYSTIWYWSRQWRRFGTTFSNFAYNVYINIMTLAYLYSVSNLSWIWSLGWKLLWWYAGSYRHIHCCTIISRGTSLDPLSLLTMVIVRVFNSTVHTQLDLVFAINSGTLLFLVLLPWWYVDKVPIDS